MTDFKLPAGYEDDGWVCHMFGSMGNGISYRPKKGMTPNWFVLWMMKICFACTWIKDKR